MPFKDTHDEFICAALMIYSIRDSVDELNTYINHFNKQGLVVVGAARPDGMLVSESQIIMHVKRVDTPQLSAVELFEASNRDRPWYVDEFLSRR